MKAILLPALLLILASCGNTKTSNTSQPSADPEAIATSTLATDSTTWVDSLTMGNSKANVKLSVVYPVSGNPGLVDSVSSWIRGLLPNPASNKDAATTTPTPTSKPIDPQTIAQAGKSFLEIARTDFAGFDTLSMEYPIRYEWIYDIRPIYLTDSIITYNSMRYVYLAGAHGSTLADTQTFRIADGLPLTAANLFKPDSIPALTNLIRRYLYTQYFLPQLSDCLLYTSPSPRD